MPPTTTTTAEEVVAAATTPEKQQQAAAAKKRKSPSATKKLNNDLPSSSSSPQRKRAKTTAEEKEKADEKICKVDTCTNNATTNRGLCFLHDATVTQQKAHQRKLRKLICNVDGCVTPAKGGYKVCQRHGAKIKKKLCNHPDGCTNQAQSGGVCRKHGAKPKLCSVDGCNKQVIKLGLCTKHGPKIEICSLVGCQKRAQEGGKCFQHGGQKKRCRIRNCIHAAGRRGICDGHLSMTTVAKKEASMLLTVSPGTLGLVLKIDKELGGATVNAIDPACTFKDRIEVGDRIVTIDDYEVSDITDFNVNKDKMRQLGIVKKKDLESALLKTMDDLELKVKEAKSLSGGEGNEAEAEAEADEIQSLIGTLTDVLTDTIYKEEAWNARLQAAKKREEELTEKLRNAASQYRELARRNETLQKANNALKVRAKAKNAAVAQKLKGMKRKV